MNWGGVGAEGIRINNNKKIPSLIEAKRSTFSCDPFFDQRKNIIHSPETEK